MQLKLLLSALLCCLMSVNGSLAHTKMMDSVPAEGGTAKVGLGEIRLSFAKPVRLMLVKVRNTYRSRNIKAGFKPASAFKTTFPFKVTPLSAGAHRIEWTAIAEDGHVMKGTLSFNVVE